MHIALIHNNIEAYLFVTSETILKHLHDLSYLIYMSQGPRDGEMWDFGAGRMKLGNNHFIAIV
jgi:hypothetical protein